MCSASKWAAITLLAPLLAATDLRVCADPNNLPFSNSQQQGFENDLARMAAAGLGRTVQFVWIPQRGRYLKKTLGAGACDVMIGVPAGMQGVRSTRPYYRSGYVFAFRRNGPFAATSFDDARLRRARIGVQVAQHEDASNPAVQELMRRGLFGNIRWYKIYPDFTRQNPVFGLLDALQGGEIDVAIAWGPTAGYFVRQASAPIAFTPAISTGSVPMTFDISMGVAPRNAALAVQLDHWIAKSRPRINSLLDRYGIPRESPARSQHR